ncbi:hypothetical protein NEOLEDRAFT_1079861 [Neolentinus lepideus HHB14362 ss-1]|uniref:Uncharacterized protein n=1 Tax=Neolentinus lepideus HHB14362 ss-1 TaxID=1314782 RepID=A0A165MMR9_9AGAM|nr:hypothetical protein NEOLEDRAFT_1079861 [Neolentinus lepideus HHB14362 ss-1]
MPNHSKPTVKEIRSVARTATRILKDEHLNCCVFGSLACNLYGTNRRPNDVDLVVMAGPYDLEQLKELLTIADRRFYLIPSQNPEAKYKVLYFRLRGRKRSCKVDILRPRIMTIPAIPRRRIEDIEGIPVMPISALLLMKLKGWSDSKVSKRTDALYKERNAVADINDLLAIAKERNLWMPSETWLPKTFQRRAVNRVQAYVNEVKGTDMFWDAIGYEV